MREKVYMAGRLGLILTLLSLTVGICWADEDGEERWDLLTIDTLKQFGDLERPNSAVRSRPTHRSFGKIGKELPNLSQTGRKVPFSKIPAPQRRSRQRVDDGPLPLKLPRLP